VSGLPQRSQNFASTFGFPHAPQVIRTGSRVPH
jgi:hypothetical protein